MPTQRDGRGDSSRATFGVTLRWRAREHVRPPGDPLLAINPITTSS
jgi:hypothetical protein